VLAPKVATRLVERAGPQRNAQTRLTPREIEVLSLVAKGETNQVIARSLKISEATVKTHLVNVFEKLDVDDRTAAVTVAISRGILRVAD
jgi:DNA-binding NarL/FixJ family response regulator